MRQPGLRRHDRRGHSNRHRWSERRRRGTDLRRRLHDRCDDHRGQGPDPFRRWYNSSRPRWWGNHPHPRHHHGRHLRHDRRTQLPQGSGNGWWRKWRRDPDERRCDTQRRRLAVRRQPRRRTRWWHRPHRIAREHRVGERDQLDLLRQQRCRRRWHRGGRQHHHFDRHQQHFCSELRFPKRWSDQWIVFGRSGNPINVHRQSRSHRRRHLVGGVAGTEPHRVHALGDALQ